MPKLGGGVKKIFPDWAILLHHFMTGTKVTFFGQQNLKIMQSPKTLHCE